MNDTPIQPPFEAIKARTVLIWVLIPPLLGALLLAILLSSYFDSIPERDLGLQVMAVETAFSGLVVWWLCARLEKLGLPLKAFLGPQVWLSRLEATQVIVMNLFLAWGFTILPHLLALQSGNWSEFISDDVMVLRWLDSPSALVMNLLLLLTVVIMAPVFEEIVFRGFLLHRFAVKWGMRDAIWMSCLIFGLVHGFAPGIFLVGLTLALVYLRTGGNLRQTMLLHAGHNLCVTVFSSLTALLGLPMLPENSTNWLLLELGMLVLGGLMFWVFLLEYRQSWKSWPPFVTVAEPIELSQLEDSEIAT